MCLFICHCSNYSQRVFDEPLLRTVVWPLPLEATLCSALCPSVSFTRAFRTSGERKLSEKWLTQVHLENGRQNGSDNRVLYIG